MVAIFKAEKRSILMGQVSNQIRDAIKSGKIGEDSLLMLPPYEMICAQGVISLAPSVMLAVVFQNIWLKD